MNWEDITRERYEQWASNKRVLYRAGRLSSECIAACESIPNWSWDFKQSFLPFAEARAFVRTLGVKNQIAWGAYCKSGNRPHDIPSGPNIVYKDKGWVSLGDWLGTDWPSFVEARALAKSLKLSSAAEYKAQRPNALPAHPDRYYKGKGWAGWPDWLGRIGRNFLPFEEARAFVQGLGLHNCKEWRAYLRSTTIPSDMPASPEFVYKDTGWVSMGDWLGTGNTRRSGQHRLMPFAEARTFVQTLGLRSINEWRAYCNSGKKPVNIPSNTYQAYATKGWISASDWLGTGNKRGGQKRIFLPFAEARAFVRSLGLASHKEWNAYCKSGQKPKDIPSTPYDIYKDNGWAEYGDWLGTGRGSKKKAKAAGA
jgi:hypothetical protein